jgi:DNA uptake protein ComE-like DNA-binding protein
LVKDWSFSPVNSAALRAQSAGPEKSCGPAILFREKGVILVAVLWICALIMWLALQIGAETRLQGEEQIHVTRKSQAYYLAIGGCFEALARMAQAPSLNAEEPSDLNWLPDGLPRAVSYDTGVAVVVIESEEQKVNVNKAQPEQLKTVFDRAGAEESVSLKLADLIADFVDRDDIPRLHGGEKNQYKKWGLPYGPFNGPFTSLDQLLLIPGITHQLYYGYVRTSGTESPERSEIFKDLLIPSKDSFFSLCTIYGNNTRLPQAPETEELALKPLVWKQGGIYRILSFGKSFNGPPAVCYWMVVRLTATGRNPYKVLYRKVL